jgi:RsmE family RNA methyltransferase
VNLILIERTEVSPQGDVLLSDARAAHLVDVLHVLPGQHVRVGLIDGPRGTGIVTALDAGRVGLRCAFEADVPDRPRVDLLLAVPRPKVMRRLWAQLAAVGVGRIILTNATRVERNYFDTHLLTEAAYRPLLIEGLQQARDTRLPLVSIHRRFRVLVEDDLDALAPGTLRLVAHPGAASRLRDSLERSDQRVLLAIGPEGGWNEFELALLRAHGFTPFELGPRTLRTDTACVALVSLAHDLLSSR